MNQAGIPLADPLGGSGSERAARVFVLVAIGIVSAAIFGLMQPWYIFTANTPSGGDMGAHVLLPAVLRDSVLPSGRLLGWSGDWYAGFPVLYFYFPLPAFAIVLLDVLLPYGVAFKLVTVAGLVAMPPAAYYFARSMGFERAVAVVGGVAGGFFVLMENYSILGGNTLSTLAGEYSYSWSMALSLFYLGLLIRNVRQGKGFSAGPAVLLAMTALCHIVTASVAVVASAAVLFRRRGPTHVLGSWGLGFLIAGWWAVPVVIRKFGGLMTSMGWWPREQMKQWLWPEFGEYCETACPARDLAPLLLLAVGGIVWAATRRKRIAAALLMMAFPIFVFYRPWRIIFSWELRDTLNARWLPYFYFGVFLFAGLFVGMLLVSAARRLRQVTSGQVFAALVAFLAAAEGVAVAVNFYGSGSIPGHLFWVALLAVVLGLGVAPTLLAHIPERPVRTPMYVLIGTLSLGSLAVWAVRSVDYYSEQGASIFVLVAMPVVSAALLAGVMLVALWRPAPRTVWVAAGIGVLLFMNVSLFSVHKTPAWAAWNYSGYEGKGSYPEYQALMEALDELPPGRVMWEVDSGYLGRYGTPMALMLTGYWSEGHPSMEGLLFESSLTTDFHFLNASEMSVRPSNPIPGLNYRGFNLARAVVHMEVYDVAYYVTVSETVTEAAADAGFEVLAETDPFTVYALPEASLVDVAAYVPAVWDGEQEFRAAALDWYDDVDSLDYWMVADGSDEWPRVEEVGPDDRQTPYETGGTVSDIHYDDYSISFHTEAIGVPHLVKVSYFPNWQAHGAEGPYRAAPSLMIVVPTQEDVTITFDRQWDDNLGLLLSGIGLAVLVALWLRRRSRRGEKVGAADLAVLPESPANAS
jgi:hypothetical protein